MNDQQIAKVVNAPKAVFATTLMGTAAIIMFLLLPLLVGAVAETVEATEQQLGLLASSDLFGFGIGAFIGLFWARKVNWRMTTIALLALLILANFLSVFMAANIELLCLSRLVAGLAQGSLLAIYSAHITDTLKPEKYYAYYLAVQTATSGIGLLLLPQFIEKWGIIPVIHFQTLLAVLSILAVILWMPLRGFARELIDGKKIRINWKASLPALLGLIAFFVAQGGVWAYMERVGNSQGINAQFIGFALSIAMGGSFFGSLVASYLEVKYGRKRPLIFSAIFQIICLILIFSNLGKWTYFGAGLVFCTFWNFALPYMIGILIEVDESGKTILAANPTFAIGVAIAPLIISSFVSQNNYLSVGYVGGLAIVVSLGLFLWAMSFIKKPVNNLA